MRRVLFDNIIFDIQLSGGISTVWRQIISSALRHEGLDCRFMESAEATANYCRRSVDVPAERILISRGNQRLNQYLNPRIDGEAPDVFHSSYYRTLPGAKAVNITTLHDFTYELIIGGIAGKVNRLRKNRAVRRSDYVVCVSENTRRDFDRFFPDFPRERLLVIHNGVSDEFAPDVDVIEGLNDCLLYVGSRAPYKNFPLAAATAAGAGMRLAVCGSPFSTGEIVLLDRILGRGRYTHLGFPDNKKLNRIYNSVFCLVNPSVYEGFGLPLVEAQRAGCPVVALNNSSVPEVVTYSHLFPTGSDIEALVRLVNQMKAGSLRNELVEAGIDHSARFSSAAMTDRYLSLYTSAKKKK